MGKRTGKRMVFTSIGVVASFLGAILATNAWLEPSLVETASLLQTMVTSLAIGIGAVWAFHKLEVFKDFQPHLTISQEVTHRKLGNNHVHVSVIATLLNNSKVAVEIRHAEFRIQQDLTVRR